VIVAFRIETARLILREFTTEDAQAFHRLRSDRAIVELTGEPALETVEEAREDLAAYPDYREQGFGRWACVLKSTGAVIGFSGPKYLPELDEVDVGYRFHEEHWGKGLATESARAVIDWVWRETNLPALTAYVLPQNAGSIRVLEKLDFQNEGLVDVYDTKALRFLLTRPAP
jgi:RimJ/RimL family protein N-acetyltransferase